MGKFEYLGTLVCSINVSNLDRSVRWYHDGLGFDEIYRMEGCDLPTASIPTANR